MPDDRDRLLAEEAASQLKLSIDELKDLRRKGRIRGYPNYGAWVFERDDVARLAEEMGIEAPPTSDLTDPTAEETAEETARPKSIYKPASLESAIRDASDQAESSTIPADRSDPSPPVATTTPEEPPPATPSVSLAEWVDSDQPIPSARIIEALAAQHGVSFDQAAGVIDRFWDHLLDAERYNQGNRKFSLPHFGTFSLGRGHEQQTELRFVSRPIADLQSRRNRSGSQRPSTAWIDHWERHEGSTPARLSGLSLKRRLAVLIAGDTGLDLRTTFGLLWDLVEAVTDIMAGGKASIRWARRGEMSLDSDSNCYTFRTYKRLSDQLPELPAPSRGRQKRASRGINPFTGEVTGRSGRKGNAESLRLEIEGKKLSFKIMIGCALLGLVFFVLPIVIAIVAAVLATDDEMGETSSSEVTADASLKVDEDAGPPRDGPGRRSRQGQESTRPTSPHGQESSHKRTTRSSDSSSSGDSRKKASNSTDRIAGYFFKRLDKDEDGKLSAREWKAGGRLRAEFKKKKIKLTIPAGVVKFAKAFAASRGFPDQRKEPKSPR
ncbi:MAG: hypothetical protein QF363_05170 [Planctomycetaceae bacterium]|nr:hypothetical protein [Planctomycetaceae bacterium]